MAYFCLDQLMFSLKTPREDLEVVIPADLQWILILHPLLCGRKGDMKHISVLQSTTVQLQSTKSSTEWKSKDLPMFHPGKQYLPASPSSSEKHWHLTIVSCFNFFFFGGVCNELGVSENNHQGFKRTRFSHVHKSQKTTQSVFDII